MDWGQYQTLALAEVLSQNEGYILRKVCREYSVKFNTPLHEVHKLPFHFVLTNWMESRIESLDENSLRELAQDIVGIDASEEALIQDQIQQWEQEYAKKKPSKAKSKNIKPQALDLSDFEPKTLDFSDLDNES
jgi:hypothetical protein